MPKLQCFAKLCNSGDDSHNYFSSQLNVAIKLVMFYYFRRCWVKLAFSVAIFLPSVFAVGASSEIKFHSNANVLGPMMVRKVVL